MGDLNILLWIWLGIFIVTLVVELMTDEFISIWFTIAAIPTMIIAIYDHTLWIHLTVFFSIATILLISTRPVVIKYLKRNVVDTNIDTFVGKLAIVTKDITKLSYGEVRFNGNIWTAVADHKIAADTVVKIVAVEGNKLVVAESNEK